MPTHRIITAASLPADLRMALQAAPDALIDQGETLKHDRTTTVVKLRWQNDYYLLKRYNARNVWHTVKRSLRESRAQRCWHASAQFDQAGIIVAEPMAMLEKRYGPFCGQAYFLTRFVAGVELLDWLPRQSESQQQVIAQQLQMLFQRMIRYRLSHGDMKATNVLWDGENIVLIDLDAATQHRSTLLWHKRFQRDLRRFRRNGAVFASIATAIET